MEKIYVKSIVEDGQKIKLYKDPNDVSIPILKVESYYNSERRRFEHWVCEIAQYVDEFGNSVTTKNRVRYLHSNSSGCL